MRALVSAKPEVLQAETNYYGSRQSKRRATTALMIVFGRRGSIFPVAPVAQAEPACMAAGLRSADRPGRRQGRNMVARPRSPFGWRWASRPLRAGEILHAMLVSAPLALGMDSAARIEPARSLAMLCAAMISSFMSARSCEPRFGCWGWKRVARTFMLSKYIGEANRSDVRGSQSTEPA